MYSRPSASQRREPAARSTINGVPPTARNARTGLFTPPTRIFFARSKSSAERECVLEAVLALDFPDFSLGIECRIIPVRQILKHRVPRAVCAKRGHDDRQRIAQNVRKIPLRFRKYQPKGQTLN